jgi:acyl-CoA synthetase (AMP-forming)/AMP-acid ligase II
MVHTEQGVVASTKIEDALYGYTGVALCIAAGRSTGTYETPIAAIELHSGVALDLDALAAAVRTLPEYARPQRVRVVESLPMTDGFRAIKRGLRDLDAVGGPNVYQWDPRTQRFATPSSSRLGQRP